MMDFIPAQEWPVFIGGFRRYVKWLFMRRFKQIWIHQQYHPSEKDRTIYFLNHTSWWDGLIPFLLNEYRLRQQGRALMEHRQMKKYPFFKWIGAFSIKTDDQAHQLRSLRYALRSMKRPRSSLFIYPQGEIKPPGQQVEFKPGIGWLYAQLPEVDFVPVGIHVHTIRHDKPELHLWTGSSVQINDHPDRQQITTVCQNKLNSILDQLFETAGFDDQPYEPFWGNLWR